MMGPSQAKASHLDGLGVHRVRRSRGDPGDDRPRRCLRRHRGMGRDRVPLLRRLRDTSSTWGPNASRIAAEESSRSTRCFFRDEYLVS